MGAVNTTYTFTATDTITSTKMNNIIDETTLTADAISGTTLEITGTGKVKVRSQGITSNEIAENAVTTTKIVDASITTAKILDSAITEAKVANDAIGTAKIPDSAITTAKIADANVTPAKLSQPITRATSQNTTSGTSIDFAGIPSWVKRITVILSGVSTNGTSPVILQLGDSGGVETSGYLGSATEVRSTPDSNLFTTGFALLNDLSAGDVAHGIATIANLSGDVWVYSFCGGCSTTEQTYIGGGSKTLSATLDRLRLTTVGGVNTFDAGSINIMYE
jgi:hypothetical protein